MGVYCGRDLIPSGALTYEQYFHPFSTAPFRPVPCLKKRNSPLSQDNSYLLRKNPVQGDKLIMRFSPFFPKFLNLFGNLVLEQNGMLLAQW
jgi:hypothetical protein